ncbi:lysylphosphatidylglycerol synthase transmembrane domain-containing protein [Deminuibacter soli]|uniref:UPF0104 family protein n=1 Tax=Deminuibacter soli TaxID=2291815 RepID=A0A3E1NDX9_9BACT|nr:lysylphosphatidylglycerol synthase transmembrane domain-containing protein [Deminuibacter soli]RFM26173.1 UPF0104 family protein [Deminuibacter soli]
MMASNTQTDNRKILSQDQKNNAQASLTENKIPIIKSQQIVRGAIVFSLITIAGIAAVFFYNNTGKTFEVLTFIKPGYLAICLCMLFIDLLLGGWRNHIFVRKIAPGISAWTSFKANTANMFMGAITPGHSGAGPAQIYIYMRNGLNFISAFAIALISMASTLIFMPLAALTALMLGNQHLESGIVFSLLKYGFSFFSIFLFVFLLAFKKPLLVGNGIKKMAIFVSWILPKRKLKLQAWSQKAYDNISRYQQTCRLLLSEHPGLFLLSVLITIALYLNKYCMQWMILKGLGIHADLLQVMAVQVLIQFMIYFAPSPGGSGFAEISIAVLFQRIVPVSIMPVFTLLQRAFLLFFPAIIGAFVVIGRLRKDVNDAT